MPDILDTLAAKQKTAAAPAEDQSLVSEAGTLFNKEVNDLAIEMGLVPKPETEDKSNEPATEDEPQDKTTEAAGAASTDDTKGAEKSKTEGDEAASKEEDAPPAEPVFDIMEAINEQIPDLAVSSPEEIVTHLQDMREGVMAFRAFEELGDKHKSFLEFVDHLVDGSSPEKAAYLVFGKNMIPPDEIDDPEGFAAYEKKMIHFDADLAAEQKIKATAEKDRGKRATLRNQEFENQFRTLAGKEGWDEQTQRLMARKIQAMLFGDPLTGRMMPGLVRKLYGAASFDEQGKTREKANADALDKAEQKGYARAIEDVKKKRKSLSGPPDLSESGGGEINTASSDQEVVQFAKDMGVGSVYSTDFLDRLRTKK